MDKVMNKAVQLSEQTKMDLKAVLEILDQRIYEVADRDEAGFLTGIRNKVARRVN